MGLLWRWISGLARSARINQLCRLEPFAVRPEQRDRLDGSVDRSEPARSPLRNSTAFAFLLSALSIVVKEAPSMRVADKHRTP